MPSLCRPLYRRCQVLTGVLKWEWSMGWGSSWAPKVPYSKFRAHDGGKQTKQQPEQSCQQHTVALLSKNTCPNCSISQMQKQPGGMSRSLRGVPWEVPLLVGQDSFVLCCLGMLDLLAHHHWLYYRGRFSDVCASRAWVSTG